MRQKADANRVYMTPVTRAIKLDSERMLAGSPAGMGKRGQYTSDDENPFAPKEP